MSGTQAITFVSSRAITQRRPDPSTDAMSTSAAARPCGGTKKIKVALMPAHG